MKEMNTPATGALSCRCCPSVGSHAVCTGSRASPVGELLSPEWLSSWKQYPFGMPSFQRIPPETVHKPLLLAVRLGPALAPTRQQEPTNNSRIEWRMSECPSCIFAFRCTLAHPCNYFVQCGGRATKGTRALYSRFSLRRYPASRACQHAYAYLGVRRMSLAHEKEALVVLGE